MIKVFYKKPLILLSLFLFVSGFLSSMLLNIPTVAGQAGPIVSYHFDRDPSVGENDTFIYDWSGNGNNATAQGVTWTSSGRLGGAFSFSGSNTQFIGMPNIMSANQQNAHSVSLWVRFSSAPSGYATLIAQATSYNHNSLYLLIDSSNGRLYNWRKSYAPLPAGWNDNGWHHVSYVHPANGDKTDDRFYWDGQELTTAADYGNWIEQTTVWRIGLNASGSHPVNGSLDELSVYNRTLSQAEVSGLYSQAP
jgi:hypothetical protein